MSTESSIITTSPQHGLISFSLCDFMQVDFPDRGFLLSPIIHEQGLTLLYAYRGVGKTLLALASALSVASGSKLFHWTCIEPRGVLYIDGEMSAQALQERLRFLARGAGINVQETLLQIITPDTQAHPMPNLALESGQRLVEPHLEGVSLVIVDNLACLCSMGKENEAESWTPVQRWLLNLKRRGISALIVHHAGKSGEQRGTSAREDVMDTVVALKHPEDYQPEEGARFEVHIKKSRNVAGSMVAPFEAQLRQGEESFLWSQSPIHDPQMEEVRALSEQNFSIRAITEKTGIPRTTVHRLLQKAQQHPL